MTDLVRRRLRSRRGNIMLHVLVTAIVVMIIAAGLMRLVMIRYIAIQRANDGGNNKRVAEAAVAAVVGRWSVAGRSCQDLPSGFSWTSGPAAGCSCAMSGNVTVGTVSQAVTVTSTAGTGTQCRLSVNTGT